MIQVLTHFKSMFHFYTPYKSQETSGILTFSGVIEISNLISSQCDNVFRNVALTSNGLRFLVILKPLSYKK